MSATSNRGLITFFPCSASTRPPDSGWIVNSQSAPAKEVRLPFPERLAISAFTSRFSSAICGTVSKPSPPNRVHGGPFLSVVKLQNVPVSRVDSPQLLVLRRRLLGHQAPLGV